MAAPVAVIPIRQLGSVPDAHASTHGVANGAGDNGDEGYWRRQASASASTSTRPPLVPTSTTRPPLVPAADLLFPPLFVVAAGAACWLAPRFLTAPLLLLLLVPCYVLGVFFFVVRLGGFSPPHLPASRLVASSAASLLCASFWSFAAFQLPLLWMIDENNGKALLPFLRLRVRAESATLIACFSLFLILQLRLSTADPGRVDASSTARPRVPPNHHAGTCSTCGVLRPLRSKHCSSCGACVRRMDHHCPVVANCVGEDTQAEFLAFLKVTVTGQFLMLRLAWVAACVAFGEAGEEALSSVLARASREARGQLLLCVVQVPIFLSTIFLVLRGFFCAAANLTVNELAGRSRYAYLRHEREGGVGGGGGVGGEGGSLFVNRFDRGVVENLSSFFRLERRFPSDGSCPVDGDDHRWSRALDAALAEHGPGGMQPPPLATRLVRRLDAWSERRRKRRGRRGKPDAAPPGGAGASGPSPLDVELAPLWGEGKGGA